MITQLLKETIISHLPPTKSSRKGWQTCNCMLCHHRGHNPDTRGRFGVLFSEDGSISVNCFNCKFGASWKPGKLLSKDFKFFLEATGVSEYDIKKINFEIFKLNSEISTDSSWAEEKRSVLTKWTQMDLPADTKPFSFWLNNGCSDQNFLKVAEYCISRDLIDVDALHWSPSSEMMYNKRFILPFYYNGVVVGYTARYFKDIQSKKIPKYINVSPDSFVYNLTSQYARDRKYVILNEGVLDAYVTDGISPLGTINGDQIDLINKLNKQIIVCADNDKDGQNLINVAVDNNWAVSFPPWRKFYKDAASAAENYGRVLTAYSIIEYAESKSFAIQLKSKMIK